MQDFADFGRGSVGHAHDAVRKKESLVDVVGHHEGGDFVSTPELEKHLLQLISGERIERAEGFIEQEHFRPKGKGARNADALPHALGELGGAYMHRVTKANDSEVILNDFAAFDFGRRKIHLVNSQLDVLESGEPGQQARRLKDDSAVRARPVELLAGEDNAAPGNGIQAGEHREHGALAATGMADQADKLTFADAQVEIFYDDRVSFRSRVYLGQIR